MTALIAPAEAPDRPAMPRRPSSSSSSITPQVKAPCAPPPCKARLTRLRTFGFRAGSPPRAQEKSLFMMDVSSRCGPTAVDRNIGAGDGGGRIGAEENRERGDL